MSIQAVAWVLEHSESKLADRLVLLAIANHADAHGCNAWPSVDQIAKEARIGRSTVFECLPRLEDLGELKISRGGRGPRSTNSYQIQMQGSENQTLLRVQNLDKRVQNPEKRVQPVNHKPSLTEIKTSRVRARETQLPDLRPLTETERQRGKVNAAALRQAHGWKTPT